MIGRRLGNAFLLLTIATPVALLSSCDDAAGLYDPGLEDEGLPGDTAAPPAAEGDTVVFDGNPLFWGADPAGHVWPDGRLWVYPTRADADWDELTGWDAWSTEDLRTWVRHRDIFTAEQCAWCFNNAWAPDVAYRDGRYYLYYYFRNDDTKPRGVGVAVANDPGGPFTNLTPDAPLVDGHDPAVLVDDDGQAYLYAGGAILFLNEDMASLEVGEDGELRQMGFWLRGHELVGGWEALWVFKREGRYYFTVVDDDYRQIRYYLGDSPTGPFDYGGILLSRPNPSSIHHSIVPFQGRWILFYHLWPLAGSGKRRVSAEFLTFRDDGTIEPVYITGEGIAGH